MCADNPCANNATCRSSFTDKLYQCLCPAGYKGPRCQTGNQKNPLYRSSEIFNSIIKKHSSRTLTTWTCVIYIVISKQKNKKNNKKKKTKERMKERDTQRKVNLHTFFLNLKLASKIWKVILIVGKWSGLKHNYNEPTHEYIWFSTNEIEKKSKWLAAIPPDPLIHLFVSFASCFFCCLQTSMSVPKGFTIAVPMPFATIPKGLTTAHASPDSLGMAEDAKVHANVDFCTH